MIIALKCAAWLSQLAVSHCFSTGRVLPVFLLSPIFLGEFLSSLLERFLKHRFLWVCPQKMHTHYLWFSVHYWFQTESERELHIPSSVTSVIAFSHNSSGRQWYLFSILFRMHHHSINLDKILPVNHLSQNVTYSISCSLQFRLILTVSWLRD